MDEQHTQKLAPCPFCACTDIDPRAMTDGERQPGDGGAMPGCRHCGAVAPSVEAWNRRAYHTITAAQRARYLEDAGKVDELQAEIARRPGRIERMGSDLGVPEEVQRLPENWRLASRTARRQMDPSVGQQISSVYSGCADELDRALANASAMQAGLSFDQLRKANVQRCETAFHALNHWNPMEWGAACAGEVGEGINAAKKLRRVQDSEQYKKTLPTTDVTTQDVADEIADTVIYADLWAASMGIDLGAVVANKFNRTSEKVQSDVKLPAAPMDGGEHE